MPVLGPATTPPPHPDFDRFRGALLGLAVGDALAAQTEQITHGGQLETPCLQLSREHPAPATLAAALAAALESIRSTGSFRAALLRTVNQTNETAATIAVCGQIAGAHYGVSGIPEEWLERLAWRKAIEKIVTHLSTSSMRRHQTPVQSHHR
jgi:ADP-ribosylglycohydrolase